MAATAYHKNTNRCTIEDWMSDALKSFDTLHCAVRSNVQYECTGAREVLCPGFCRILRTCGVNGIRGRGVYDVSYERQNDRNPR